MKRCLKSALALAALAATLPCAHAKTSSHDRDQARKVYLDGAKALEAENYETAEKDFTRAVDLDPENQQYIAARDTVVSAHATSLIQAADKAKMLGHSEEARADLLLAYRLDPNNPMVAQHLDEIADNSAPEEPQLYPDNESFSPPVALAPSPEVHSFHLHTVASDALHQVLMAYGITPTIDSSVRNEVVRLDADNVSFNDATRMVRLLTNTFFVPLDPKRVLIASDSKENRTKYQRLAYETVYFPGLDPAEVTGLSLLARNVFSAQQTTVSPNNATLAIRAPLADIVAFNGTMSELLDGHSVVQVEVHLYDIAKTKSTNIGVQLPQTATLFNIPSELNSILSQNQALVQQIIAAGLASPSDQAGILLALLASGQLSGSTILSQPFAVFGGGLTLTGLTTGPLVGNLALNSSDSRVIDHLTMRLLDQQESTIKAGERYPIITSSYSSFGATGLGAIAGLNTSGISSTLQSLGISAQQLAASSSQIIPQVQYQDLGLTLKIKPYIEKNKDVTLNLDLKIDALQGTSLNGVPVLSNQEFTTITTLPPGFSALVVSNLSKQQSRAVDGVPGLSELPGFQSTTNLATQYDFSDLVIVITPHIIRLAHKQEAGKMFILPVH